MSEGSFWPKTWKEASPLLIWGVLIFALGFEGIASLLHGEVLQTVLGFGGMVALTAMLIQTESWKERLSKLDGKWQIAAALVVLIVIALSPYAEHGLSQADVDKKIEDALKPVRDALDAKTQELKSTEQQLAIETARVALRDDQIAQLKDQIAQLTDKVGTASPGEVRARIYHLEELVKSMSPRRLSDAQRATLSNALKKNPGNVEIEQDMAVADARGFAGDLVTAFKMAGWGIEASMIMGPGMPPPHGIGLIVSNPGALTPRQTVIDQALKAAGITFDLQQGAPRPVRPALPGQPTPPPFDALILVSQKVL